MDEQNDFMERYIERSIEKQELLVSWIELKNRVTNRYIKANAGSYSKEYFGDVLNIMDEIESRWTENG